MDELIRTIGDAILAATQESDLVKSLKDQIRTLTTSLSNAEKLNRKLTEELGDAERQNAALRKNASIYTDKISLLSNDMARAASTNVKLHAELNKLRKSYTAACNQRDSFAGTVTELKVKLSDAYQTTKTNYVDALNVNGIAYTAKDVIKLRDNNIRLSAKLGNESVHITNPDTVITVNGCSKSITAQQLHSIINNNTTLTPNIHTARITSPELQLSYENIDFPARLIPRLWRLYQNDSARRVDIGGIAYDYSNIIGAADTISKLRAENEYLKASLDRAKCAATEAASQSLIRITNPRAEIQFDNHRICVGDLFMPISTPLGNLVVSRDAIQRLSDQLTKALAANKKALDGILAATKNLQDCIA